MPPPRTDNGWDEHKREVLGSIERNCRKIDKLHESHGALTVQVARLEERVATKTDVAELGQKVEGLTEVVSGQKSVARVIATAVGGLGVVVAIVLGLLKLLGD